MNVEEDCNYENKIKSVETISIPESNGQWAIDEKFTKYARKMTKDTDQLHELPKVMWGINNILLIRTSKTCMKKKTLTLLIHPHWWSSYKEDDCQWRKRVKRE